MEQYTIKRPNVSPSIKEGKFFHRIHKKHVESYGEIGANNIVTNVRATYSKLMMQLSVNQEGNHNSLLVGKVQSGKTSNLELLTALAFDNGYNFLIIFGGYDKDLLRQSTERFGSTFETAGGEEVLYSENPVLFTTNDLTNESLSINSLDPDFVKQLLEEGRPIIITCLKRPPAMKATLRAITKVHESVSGIVPFIIDDEGDQASLNTSKDKARNSTPTYKSIVRIKENDLKIIDLGCLISQIISLEFFFLAVIRYSQIVGIFSYVFFALLFITSTAISIFRIINYDKNEI